MLSYCRNKLGYYTGPLVLFLISMAIGIFPLLLFSSKTINDKVVVLKTIDKHTAYAIILFCAFFILFLFVPRGGIINIYKNFLVEVHTSDIIPTIQVMCQRLLNHYPIYVSIEQFGYHLPTTYMPFMWMPYLIAEKFHFDYRYITLLIFVIGIIFILFITVKKTNKGLFLVLLYAFLLLAFADKNSETFGWTVEFMNGTYYSILALTFFVDNKYVKVIALVACLLSRYSLVVFVPLYFLIEWNENGFKKTSIFALLTLALMVVFLVPLVRNNWIELYNGYKYYTISGLGEWNHTDSNGLPLHIFNGNGFVAWIYSFKNGSIEERFAFAKSLHFILISSTTMLLTLIYYKFKDSINNKVFLLCSLKIYLAVFYGFIQVPYTYLFVVPAMYSIVLLFLTNNIYYNNLVELKSVNEIE